MSRNLYSIEFQEQALSKVRERGTRSVLDVADDLHMSAGTLRKWIAKSRQAKADAGEPTAKLPDDSPVRIAMARSESLSRTYMRRILPKSSMVITLFAPA